MPLENVRREGFTSVLSFVVVRVTFKDHCLRGTTHARDEKPRSAMHRLRFFNEVDGD
jgi:hypothetical protein